MVLLQSHNIIWTISWLFRKGHFFLGKNFVCIFNTASSSVQKKCCIKWWGDSLMIYYIIFFQFFRTGINFLCVHKCRFFFFSHLFFRYNHRWKEMHWWMVPFMSLWDILVLKWHWVVHFSSLTTFYKIYYVITELHAYFFYWVFFCFDICNNINDC